MYIKSRRRIGNVKVGKFTASVEDMASEDYNEEEYENLNDIETVLDSIGIKLRENATTYKDTEEVLQEIADIWDTLDETTQNALTTALAGTRQREIVLTLFENWDSVKNFARISADSYGTAEEKMLAFTDSIEAAQNRVTDAVDQWALWANGAEAMKDFYNILAYVIRNLDTFGITIGGLLLALNAKSVLNTVAGGIGKAGSATIGFTNKVDNFMSNLSTKGIGTTMADTIYGALETSYLESVQEKYTNQLIKATQGLQKEEQTRAVNLSKMLMEGDERDTLLANMISQNEVTAQNTHLSSKYGLRLIAADGTMTELLTVEERQKLANMLLNTNIDEKTREIIKSITTSKNLQLSQEQLNAMSDALAQAYKNEIIELSTGTSSGYRDETGNGNWKTGLKAGLATGASSIIAGVSGSILGSNLGSAFGEDGQIAGTMIGGVLAETAVPVFAKAMGKGLLATAAEGGVLSGAFSKIGGLLAGPFGAALLMGIPAIISVVLGIIESQTQQAIEDSANYFQEQSDKYSSMTSVLNDVTTFDKYATGVDRLGKNVSLTDDEYQKWLDSSNALAEVFPDLIQYTDDQGNAIVGLNGGVATLTDTINEMIDAQQRATDQALLDPTLFNANYNEAKKSWDTAKEGIEGTKEALDALNQGFTFTESEFEDGSIMGMFESFFGGGDEATLETHTRETANLIKNILKEAGYDASTDSSTGTSVILKGVDPEKEEEVLSLVREKINEQMNGLENDMENASDSVSDQVNAMLREMGKGYFDNMLDFDYDSYGDSISKMFEDIPDEEMQAIQNTISGMGLDSQAEDYAQTVVDTIKQIHQQIEENPAIMELYLDASEAETVGEQSQLRKQLENLLTATFGTDGWTEGEKQFAIQLGFVFDDEGNLQDSLNNYQTLLDRMQVNSLGAGVTENWVNSLDIEDWNQVFEYFTSGVVDASTSVQTLTNLLYADRDVSGLENTMTQLTEQLTIFEGLGDRVQDFYESFDGSGEELTKAVTEAFSDVPEEIRNKIEDGYDEFQEAGEGGGEAFVAGMMEEIYDSNLTNQYEAYLGELAQTAFPDLEFDGYIDSFSELQQAMESVASTYDQLKTAQEEQAATGKLSWQTILDLVSANTQYVNALDFTTNGIKLKSNAEQIMLQIQMAAIKTNIQAAISELENRNAILQTAIQKLKQGEDVSSVATTVATSANIEISAIDKTTNAWLKAYNAAKAYHLAAEGDIDGAKRAANAALGDAGVSSSKASTGTKFKASSGASYKADSKAGGSSKLDAITDSIKASTEGFIQAGSELSDAQKYFDSELLNSYAMDPLQKDKYGKIYYGQAWGNSEAQSLIDKYQAEYDTNLNQIKTYQEFLNNLESTIKGDMTLDDWYTTPDYDSGRSSGSGSGADDEIESAKKYLEELQNLQDLINKEWEDMVAFANNTDSAYYGKMRENLTAQLEEVNNLLNNFDTLLEQGRLEESDYYDLLQQRIDLQVELNNLDDEQVQEAIDLLETQDASINSLIEAQKQLIETSDTYEELIERQQELNELIEEQKELQRDVYEFERTMAEMASEYVSGTAFTNAKIYDAFMSLQKQSIEEQMESLLDSYNTVVTQKMQQYSAEGMSPGEAYNMAYDSEEARELIQEYWELFQEYGDLVYQEFEDKVNELDQMIEDIEYTKPDEWGNINDIAPYYETLIGYVEQKVKQIEEALSDTSMMTDEQIQDWVDQYNDAIQELRDLQQQQLEDTIQYQEDTFSALTSWVQEQIDALQDLQDTIDDEYQPLIDDINDYNDAVDRTNELLKLQKNLKDSLSSKERVYREGMKMPSIKAR